jgi:hypothetical protein
MNEAQSRIRPLLRQSEQLRWVGKPDPRVLFTPADAFLVPFSLMWGGFAVFWEIQVITGDSPGFFALWGIPFVLIGLYFIAGRFIYKRFRKRSTVYGLTDSRAIVSSSHRAYDEIPLNGTPLSIRRSRSGRHVSVAFGPSRRNSYQNTGLDFFSMGQDQGVAFFDVDEPDALIRELDSAR